MTISDEVGDCLNFSVTSTKAKPSQTGERKVPCTQNVIISSKYSVPSNLDPVNL